MEKLSKEQEIIKLLFKDFLTLYNSRSISKLVGISHAGAFKILKRLEKRSIVTPRRIGKAVTYSLNKENPITSREIELVLTIEAQGYLRWIEEFKDLGGKVRFVILFGSIIENEKRARDVDLLVVAEKEKFVEIKRVVEERRRFLNKEIHFLFQTVEDFKKDLRNENKVTLDIIKKGIVIFCQEEFRRILENDNTK